jgi:hypothetical protein
MTQAKTKATKILKHFMDITNNFDQAKRSAALAVSLTAGVTSRLGVEERVFWLDVRDELNRMTSFAEN